MTTQACGTFNVKLTALESDPSQSEALRISRMLIDKQFHGGLQATSKGEMLTAITDIDDSAAYVAMERVHGTLEGRSGTFTLRHSGTMTRGAKGLRVTVVPDSGTGQLVGLSGTMEIKVADDGHSYDFHYTLPASH